MVKKQIDEMNRQIMHWLSEEGMYKDKTTDDKAHFHFVGEYPQGTGKVFEVVQPKNRDDQILVGNALGISPEHQTKLRELSSDEKSSFLWSIKHGLLFRDSGFNILPDGNNPQQIQFITELYYDGLNKNRLMETIRENHRCNLFVIWKFMERFGESSGPEPTSPMFG
ncbi:MAG: DUF2299 family protein [Candidatus Methanoperedens sp.]|nr:DUF2299 family protein [Candidatus Methanoperedens sp.]